MPIQTTSTSGHTVPHPISQCYGNISHVSFLLNMQVYCLIKAKKRTQILLQHVVQVYGLLVDLVLDQGPQPILESLLQPLRGYSQFILRSLTGRLKELTKAWSYQVSGIL